MKNNYYDITDIQPLVDEGLRDVQIAEKLNLHKTTVGKIRKGLIRKSRQIGSKKMIRDRDVFPIWEYIGENEVYRLARSIASKSKYNCRLDFDIILDFVLDQLFFTNEDSYLVSHLGKSQERNRGITFNVIYKSVSASLIRNKRASVKRLIIFNNGVISGYTQ